MALALSIKGEPLGRRELNICSLPLSTGKKQKMGYLLLIEIICSWLLLLGMLGLLYSAVWRPLKLERYLKQQGIVGPRYKLLSGNLKENAAALKQAQAKPMDLSHQIVPRVAPYLHDIIYKYGKMSMLWFGVHPRVNIMDPDLIREILSNKFGHFGRPRANPIVRLLVTGLFSYEGEKWAKHRRIINPAFHVEKLKRMLPAFSLSCFELISKWEEMIAPGSACEVDVLPELQNLTADIISRTAFGSNYKEGNKIFRLQMEQAELIVPATLSVYIPGLRFLPTKKNCRRKEIYIEVRSLLKDMIQKREKAMILGEAPSDDLLGLLIESNLRDAQEHGSGKNVAMTIDDVIEECKLFYFAGQETTSALLTWTMIALSMHPEWQTRAREEVHQIFGKNKPDFESLSHLKTMTMILNEVLRLYPPAIDFVRVTCKEMKLGDVTFPPGVQFSLPILLVHRDPELWGSDAEEFKPERFAGGISKATKNPAAFFPFGGGPRICIGQNFALVEAKLALSVILQHFSFELSPSYAHAPYHAVTLQPQYGAQLVLHRLETN